MTRLIGTDRIIAYEMGELTEEEVIQFFQDLADTGLLWQLQGAYQRTAYALAQADLITLNKRPK